MPYEITISGIDTTFTKCIDWVTCKVDTPSTSNARANFVGNYMNISGFIGTDEVTIDLYNWAMLPVNDSNIFRNVQLTVKDANDNVIEKISFPNAFVEFYRESYMRDKGFGKFDLQLKQKIDKNGDVGVSDSSADEKSAAGSKILESVLGNAPKGGILDKGVSESDSKPDFIGKLYGNDVLLEGVKAQKIKYIKRTDEEREKLRKEFDSTEREKFIKKLAEEYEEELRRAGITDEELMLMRDGLLPSDEWQVHHKLPLDDSGTNAEENLVLIKNHPYHKVITNHQNNLTRQMAGKDECVLEFPVPQGNIYPPEERKEFERSIPKAKREKKKKS